MLESSSDEVRTSPHEKLILASRVEETPVFNQTGEQIGHIEDLSIDRITGNIIYAIMSFGGFLGIGRRFHPLPWAMLHFEPAKGGYLVPVDKSVLADAPHYDAAELRALGGPNYEGYDRIVEYYGPYGLPPI